MTDPLLEACQALREFGESGNDASSSTRARVLASNQRIKPTSKRRPLVVIPLAALLIGSLAMAATGGRLPSSVQKWLTGLRANDQRAAGLYDRRSRGRPPAQMVEAHPDSGDVPAPAVTSERASDEQPLTQPRGESKLHGYATRGTSPGHPQEVAARRAAVDDQPMTEEEYERYRLAHEAHFVNKDPAAALVAWSEYLTHSPSGRLAVEARYNRVLCLIKLGRNQDAITALRPFTQGIYGPYRQKEAQRLMAQFEGDTGVQRSLEGGN